MILYHYPHCPFCQRVRLLLGYKGIPFTEKVLGYHDIKTPKSLNMPKQLPIIDFEDGNIINESIDILRAIERKHPSPIAFVGPVEPKIQWASFAALGIPGYFEALFPFYYKYYEEFKDPKSASAFKEKEKKYGKTFAEMEKQAPTHFTQNILPHLQEIVDMVEDQYFIMGPTFSVADCILAADLSGLRLIPRVSLPPEISGYIERVEKKCHTSLLENTKENI